MSVIFPQFEKCKKYTLDSFWHEQFSNCSNNRFPSGMRYNPEKNEIQVDKKVIELPKSSQKLFLTMMKIFRDDLGMISTREIRHVQEQVSETEEENEWKKIKPKQLKNKLLSDFISSLRHQHRLDKKETNYLTAVINLGFQFKALESEDVVFDKKITEIRGLEFDPESRTFKIPSIPKNSLKTEKPVHVNILHNMIDKYIKENNNRASKYR